VISLHDDSFVSRQHAPTTRGGGVGVGGVDDDEAATIIIPTSKHVTAA